MKRAVLALLIALTVALPLASPASGASRSTSDPAGDADYADITKVTYNNGPKTLTMKVYFSDTSGGVSDVFFTMQGKKNGHKRTCSIARTPTNPPPDVICVQGDVFDGVNCGSITMGDPIVAKIPRSCAKSMPGRLRFKVRTAYTQACMGCDGKVMKDSVPWSRYAPRG